MEEWKDNIIRRAMRRNIDVEIYTISSEINTVNLDNSEIFVKKGKGGGVSLRVMKDNKLGHYSFSHDLEEKILIDEDDVLDKAVHIAETGDKELKKPPFTFTDSVTNVRDIYDRKGCIDAEEGVRTCRECVDAIEEIFDEKKEKIKKLSLRISSIVEHVNIANTYGIDKRKDATFYSFCVSIFTDRGRKRDLFIRRLYKHFDVFEVVEELEELSPPIPEEKLSSSIGEGTKVAIMHPKAFSTIIERILVPCICADTAGSLPFRGKLDESISSDELSITDDGTIDGLAYSSPFDDEGYPTQRNEVIECGIFRSFLYDNYSAIVNDVIPTGNARREHYTSDVRVKPHNLIISEGDYELDELFEEVRSGIFVVDVICTGMNIVNGELNLNTICSFRIDEGDIVSSLRNFRIRINFYDLLRRISGLSNTGIEAVPGFVSPYVLIRGVRCFDDDTFISL